MANSFSRTTRSLHADGHTTTLVGLVVVIILLVAWGAWFFAAGIPVLRSSESAQVVDAHRVVATFPAGTVDRVWRGQAARFHPESAAWEGVAPIPAMVAHVNPDPTSDRTYVEIVLRVDQTLPAPLEQDMKGRVDIELERVSPATLVMRSSGLANSGSNRNQPGAGD